MPFRPSVLLLCLPLALAACKSDKQIAADYLHKAQALIAQGDQARAIVELRNVFKYDGTNREARQTYADLLLRQGDVAEATSQLLRLVEQYPADPVAQRELAELAVDRGDWTEAERHGQALIAAAPDDPQAQAIGIVLDYRKAQQATGSGAATGVAAVEARATALLAAHPELQLLRRLLIDARMNGSDPGSALPLVDEALKRDPGSLAFNQAKLQLLIRKNDMAAVGVQLQAMAGQFPDNVDVRQSLIQWYMLQHDYDGAEAYLRRLAGADTGSADPHVTLVRFLQTARGPAAARAELDRLFAANAGNAANAELYGALLAGMDFDAGKRPGAVTALQAILDKAQPSDQTRKLQVMLAQMRDATGDRAGAAALVEKVLADDPHQIDALKLRAGWRIAADQPGDAIVDLRAALEQAPHDAQILTLLAQAYLRNGDTALASDQLSRAVDASGAAPDESLRYARFLEGQGRNDVAVTVLETAERASPASLAVLTELGALYLRGQDWARAQSLADRLSALGTPEAAAASAKVRAAVLAGQNQLDEGLNLLESQVSKSPGDAAGAVATVLQTMLRAGRTAEARDYLDAALAKAPDSAELQVMKGSLDALAGDRAAAEAVWRGVLGRDPGAVTPSRLLYALLATDGRVAEARQVLDAAIAAHPEDDGLQFLKAGALEQANDYDGAIAIYRALYAKNADNIVLANNLASLLATYRDDAASLDQAAAIARRLRALKQPAFQDTWGWIEYRRGHFDGALAELGPAAEGLPKDPTTQYHYGMALAAVGRSEEAIRQLAHALALAGDSPLPQFAAARDALAKLKAGKPVVPAPEAAAPASPAAAGN